MRFIGKLKGFTQRHYSNTESAYCPQEALIRTKSLIRGPVTLSSIRKDVVSYGTLTRSVRPADPILDQVIRNAAKAWELPSAVAPIHLNDLPTYHLDTDSSSPGLPWRNIGYRTKRQVLDDPDAFASIRSFWHVIKYGKRKQHPPDCAAYLRAHLVEEGEEKVRAVWGYPATIGFQEACFALPLIEAYKMGDYPIAYGYETARGGHLRLLNRFHGASQYLSSDFKSFDKTVPAWLIKIAFLILVRNIDFTKYRDRGVPDADALHKAWKYIVDYFINTPIRLASGERFRKDAGVASGSYFTQLIDSIVNWIVTSYCVLKSGSLIKDIVVLGDDSFVALERWIDMDKYAYYASKCGMIINKDKTQLTSDITSIKFLGYYLNNGIPLKPEEEFWAALRFPEHPDQSFDEYATRAMGLLMATFGQYSEFDRVVRSQLRQGYKVKKLFD